MNTPTRDPRDRPRIAKRFVLAVLLLAAAACSAARNEGRAGEQRCVGSSTTVINERTMAAIHVGSRVDSLPPGCRIVSDSVRWNHEHSDRSRYVEILSGRTAVIGAVDATGRLSELETSDSFASLGSGVGPGSRVKEALAAGFVDGDAFEGTLMLTARGRCSPVLWLDGVSLETGESIDSALVAVKYGSRRIARISIRRCGV